MRTDVLMIAHLKVNELAQEGVQKTRVGSIKAAIAKRGGGGYKNQEEDGRRNKCENDRGGFAKK
jgi:hypothetical protein